MNNDFKKCTGCGCYRKYPEQYLNDRARTMKTCEICRAKGKKKYNKKLEKAGKSRVRKGGSFANSEIFPRTKWIDNIEYPDSEPETGYDIKPLYNNSKKPDKGYKNSCFKVKDNKTKKLKKEDELSETEIESDSEEEEEEEEEKTKKEEEESFPLPTTQEEVKIYFEERLLNRDGLGSYYDKLGREVLTKADYALLPANAKEKIKKLKLKEEEKEKIKYQLQGLQVPTTKEQALNYVNKKLLRRDIYGNLRDKCGRIILSKYQYLLLPKDEITKEEEEKKEEKKQRRKENAKSKAPPILRAPKSKAEARRWDMMGILTVDAFGNYKDKLGRQVLSKTDFYVLPPDDEIKNNGLNFDIIRD
jgi:hypothetical protein